MDALIESLKMTEDGAAMLTLLVFMPLAFGLGWAWLEVQYSEWRRRHEKSNTEDRRKD